MPQKHSSPPVPPRVGLAYRSFIIPLAAFVAITLPTFVPAVNQTAAAATYPTYEEAFLSPGTSLAEFSELNAFSLWSVRDEPGFGALCRAWATVYTLEEVSFPSIVALGASELAAWRSHIAGYDLMDIVCYQPSSTLQEIEAAQLEALAAGKTFVEEVAAQLKVSPEQASEAVQQTLMLDLAKIANTCLGDSERFFEWMVTEDQLSPGAELLSPLFDEGRCLLGKTTEQMRSELGITDSGDVLDKSSSIKACVGELLPSLSSSVECGGGASQGHPFRAHGWDPTVFGPYEGMAIGTLEGIRDRLVAVQSAAAETSLVITGSSFIKGVPGGVGYVLNAVSFAVQVVSHVASEEQKEVDAEIEKRKEAETAGGSKYCPTFPGSDPPNLYYSKDGVVCSTVACVQREEAISNSVLLGQCMCDADFEMVRGRLAGPAPNDKLQDLLNLYGSNSACATPEQRQKLDCLRNPFGPDDGVRPECMEDLKSAEDFSEEVRQQKLCQLARCPSDRHIVTLKDNADGSTSCECKLPKPEPQANDGLPSNTCDKWNCDPTSSVVRQVGLWDSSGAQDFCGHVCSPKLIRKCEKGESVFPKMCMPVAHPINPCAHRPSGCPFPLPDEPPVPEKTPVMVFPSNLTDWKFLGGNAWEHMGIATEGESSLFVSPGKVTMYLPRHRTNNFSVVGESLLVDAYVPQTTPASGYKGTVGMHAAFGDAAPVTFGAANLSSLANDRWHTLRFDLSSEQQNLFRSSMAVQLVMVVDTEPDAQDMVALDHLRFGGNLEEHPDYFPSDDNHLLCEYYVGQSIDVFGCALVDVDDDGIADAVDTNPSVVSTEFDDSSSGGITFGSVLDPGDQLIRILDDIVLPEAGVIIAASPDGGPFPATITACDGTVNLTLFAGQVELITCPLPEECALGQSLELDATKEYRLPMAKALTLAPTPQNQNSTLEYWVRTDQDMVLYHSPVVLGPFYTFVVNQHVPKAGQREGQPICTVAGADCTDCVVGQTHGTYDTAATVDDGYWHHVACVLEGDRVSLFVDGTHQSTAVLTGRAGLANHLNFGAPGVNSRMLRALDGAVDEVRVSNTARYTPSASFVPSRQLDVDSATQLLWHFEGDGLDASGNGNNLFEPGQEPQEGFSSDRCSFGHLEMYEAGVCEDEAFLPPACAESQSCGCDNGEVRATMHLAEKENMIVSMANPETVEIEEATLEYWFKVAPTFTQYQGNFLTYLGPFQMGFAFHADPIRQHAKGGPFCSVNSFSGSGGEGTQFAMVGAGLDAPLFSDRKWHHYACVLRKIGESKWEVRLYVDGVSKHRSTMTQRPAFAARAKDSTYPGLNSNANPARAIPGQVDELRLSNVARYVPQDENLVQSFTPPRRHESDCNTEILWHFDRTGEDSSGNGHHIWFPYEDREYPVGRYAPETCLDGRYQP